MCSCGSDCECGCRRCADAPPSSACTLHFLRLWCFLRFTAGEIARQLRPDTKRRARQRTAQQSARPRATRPATASSDAHLGACMCEAHLRAWKLDSPLAAMAAPSSVLDMPNVPSMVPWRRASRASALSNHSCSRETRARLPIKHQHAVVSQDTALFLLLAVLIDNTKQPCKHRPSAAMPALAALRVFWSQARRRVRGSAVSGTAMLKPPHPKGPAPTLGPKGGNGWGSSLPWKR